MNASPPSGRARMQPRPSAVVRPTHRELVGASLADLEHRRYQYHAEAEVAWLLTQNGSTPQASVSRVALLRQLLGAALVRAGERLEGMPRREVLPDPASMPGTLGTAG